jgi:GTP-sensing pleiotropic transcriptional regulator CodY
MLGDRTWALFARKAAITRTMIVTNMEEVNSLGFLESKSAVCQSVVRSGRVR